MAHSPTPWTITEETTSLGVDYTIWDAKGEWLSNDTTYYPSAFDRKDADFIVRAVNAHDDLVAALRGLVDCHAHFSGEPGHDAEVWAVADDKARAALSKAEEAQS